MAILETAGLIQAVPEVSSVIIAYGFVSTFGLLKRRVTTGVIHQISPDRQYLGMHFGHGIRHRNGSRISTLSVLNSEFDLAPEVMEGLPLVPLSR